MKYKPHHAVTSHPEYRRKELVFVMEDREVPFVVNMTKHWKTFPRIAGLPQFQSFMKAVIWDLQTHYGVSDEEIGPPSPHFPV